MNAVDRFRNVVRSKDSEAFAAAALALRHWMMANDPHYPIYHFVGPESWINDPNGPIYYQGQHHLFYQFDPIVDGQRSNRCWGHAVSSDLVRWRDWPVALWPDTPYDRSGVYSGNTFVDDHGRLCALYTGSVDGRREAYGILAHSVDEGLNWQKKMVMDNAQRPNEHSPVHWDGYVWREGKAWQQLVGGATEGEHRQGAAWLWRSEDLEHWTLQGNIAPDLKLGDYWELPYLFPLDGKDIFMVGRANPYWLGSYDREQMIFHPDWLESKSIDNGNYYSFNPNMTDHGGLDGAPRRLMHGWVTGPASPTNGVPYWQGAHSVPRVIRVHGDCLWQEPIPEITCLRGAHIHLEKTEPSGCLPIEGDAVELQATFAAESSGLFGFKLRVSEDGNDFVRVFYDARTRAFGVDGPTIERNIEEYERLAQRRSITLGEQPSFLDAGSVVTMRVFLDRSIIEVYLNGCAYTARAFSPAGALGIEIFADEGTTTVQALDAWQMRSMWGS